MTGHINRPARRVMREPLVLPIPQNRRQIITISKDYLHFPGSATIEYVLRTYLDRDAHWRWLLTTEIEGTYYVCSFGSLLPYLTSLAGYQISSSPVG